MVRVIAPQRWSKTAIENIRGTPFKFGPTSPVDGDEAIETMGAPHARADVADEDDEQILDSSAMPKLDKRLRITLKDLQDVGFSDRCARCTHLKRGNFSTKTNHSDECRLRIYLAF